MKMQKIVLNKLKNSPECPSSSIGDAIYTEKQRPRIYHGDASFVYPHPSNPSHQPFVGTYPRIPFFFLAPCHSGIILLPPHLSS